MFSFGSVVLLKARFYLSRKNDILRFITPEKKVLYVIKM